MENYKCAWCHKDTPSYYSALTLAGSKYYFCCAKCLEKWREQKAQKCVFCGNCLFDPAQIIQYGDGRTSCLSCYQTAVLTTEQMEKSRRKIIRFFNATFQYRSVCGVVPQLCDKFVMKNNFKLGSEDLIGIYGWVETGKKLECRIFLLRGYPLELFEETMVHEMAHDMMHHLWGHTKNHVISEGFAQFVAYLYNTQNGRDKLNQQMRSSTYGNPYGEEGDPYREGLELMLSLYHKNHSYDAVKKYITDFFKK